MLSPLHTPETVYTVSTPDGMVPVPSRKAMKAKVRDAKMKQKAEWKAKVRRKAEKKLAEKEERKQIHKVANSKRKLVKKIENKKK